METSTITRKDEILADTKRAFGFVPNLIAEMADKSPAVAQVYLSMYAGLQKASLTPKEQQAVILAISAYNDCHYCKAAHAGAATMAGLSLDEIKSISSGGLPEDERYRNLVVATRRLLGKRGWLNEEDLAEFEALDINRGKIYEIVALISLKTISNYINHINNTEIDEQFK